jgi:hypothetical protein
MKTAIIALAIVATIACDVIPGETDTSTTAVDPIEPCATSTTGAPSDKCMEPGHLWGPCLPGDVCNDEEYPLLLQCYVKPEGNICYPTANCGWHECGMTIGVAAVNAVDPEPLDPCTIMCDVNACGEGTVCSADDRCVWPW